MTKSRKLIHVETIPMRWGDMDASGSAGNAAHFRYMEQARIGWSRAMPRMDRADRTGMVVVTAHCRFNRRLRYPGTIEVKLYAEAPGRSSVQSIYELRRAGEDIVYAEGGAKIVWVDFSLGKSCALPQALREACELEE
jgi:acyl-CoA thioester hydrolase